ncbi:MAG TPA: dATP pyrophosphohydrolase [Stellaceae bacterium]|nr:dATP pyrophosphohydrolase [Stellaceae bacterium]
MSNHIRVAELQSRRDLKHFLDLPERIYARDPNWVAPLRREIRKLLDRQGNPFFDHGEACFWLAWRDGVPVGRISAQINHLHLERYHDATGHFGFLEAIDDPSVFAALLRAAEDWLRARGMQRVIGPASLSINDEVGVLVAGFDTPPMIGMAHSPPYYAPRLEEAGYKKAKDLHAYVLNPSTVTGTERLERTMERIRKRGRITTRHIDMKRFREEMQVGIDIFNDGWSDNWGFVPVTQKEVTHLADSISQIIRPEGVVFAMADGVPQGILVGLPNLNEAIADLNGRLLPFGWLKLLWRLRPGRIKSGRVAIFGVRNTLRNTTLSGALAAVMLAEALQIGRSMGIERGELSWILEDNAWALTVVPCAGASLGKVYRMYEKPIA